MAVDIGMVSREIFVITLTFELLPNRNVRGSRCQKGLVFSNFSWQQVSLMGLACVLREQYQTALRAIYEAASEALQVIYRAA